MSLEPGTVVGGYQIESLVGRGGMGVVYRAHELDLNRVVALKVIAPELVEDGAIRERFLHEARAAAAIEHPHVIPIHAAGEADGLAFIAMRFVEGQDLRARVRLGGPLGPAKAASVIEQAAAGLDAIHRGGFVHRDIKPANLLLDASGHVYVTDFGLVKEVLTHSGATSTGQWVGTLDYVSPEQIRGGRIDARTDVYALGAVLYFALTGHVPFEREGDEAKLWAQLSEPPPQPSRQLRDVPARFDAVVARAMRKSPDQRFPSAGDLGRAARAAAGGMLPAEPERMVARGAASPAGAETAPGLAPESPTESAARETVLMPAARRSRRWLLPAAALGAAAASAAAVWLFAGEPPARGGALTAGTPTPSPTPAVHVAETVEDVGRRPGAIVYAAGDLWVASHKLPTLTRIDAASGTVRPQRPRVGTGVLALVADRDTVWAAVGNGKKVVGFDVRTGKEVHRIDLGAKPLRMRVDETGMWVLMAPRTNHGQRLRHFDRTGTRELEPIDLRRSHDALAIGAGSIWLHEAARQGIVRLDARTGRRQAFIRIPGQGATLNYDGGYAWVTVRSTDTVARIDPRNDGWGTVNGGHRPAQTILAAGRLFVAARDQHQVLQFDPAGPAPIDEPLDVRPNPSALATDGRSVWVTGLTENTVTRIATR